MLKEVNSETQLKIIMLEIKRYGIMCLLEDKKKLIQSVHVKDKIKC